MQRAEGAWLVGGVLRNSSPLLDIFHLFLGRRGFNYFSIKLPGAANNTEIFLH